MKCEIIKDLLPSYIDDLTSEASNEMIKTHLETCEVCTNYYMEMKADLETEADPIEIKQINVLKKLNRRVMKSVLLTLLGVFFLVSGYLYFFGLGWQVASSDMKLTPVLVGDSIHLEFELTNDRVLNVLHDRHDRFGHLKFRESFHTILDDRGLHPNQFSYGFNVYNQDGHLKIFGEDEAIVLVYEDKVELVYIRDLIKDLGLKDRH